MDRNREGRRASMAASNGVSRRRHRSGSLRDSPDEDGAAELHEPMARLRDRGVKKDRDRDRERDRDPERDRSSRRKRRRGDRLMHGSNREDAGDDTSDESVNEEDEYDEDGGGSMMTSPPNTLQSISSAMSNQHQQHRKVFPPMASRNFRGAQVLKAADEMIGVSVPRKARSASTKRMHDWISGGGVGGDLINRQESASPVRSSLAAPVSPSSSNASVRKKMMPNGDKPRHPKSSSQPSTSNPEELEIEIAEVLYGLRTHSQGPFTKEIASDDISQIDSKELNKSSGDTKFRVSSPTSNAPSTFPQSSPFLTQNTSSSGAPLSAVAPKRKRPRQISENLGNFSSRSSPVSSTPMKMEIDQHLNTDGSSTTLEKNSGAPAEKSLSFLPTSLEQSRPPEETKLEVSATSESIPSIGEGKDVRFVISTKKEVTSPKESPPVGLVAEREDVTATAVGKKVPDIESQKDEKFNIDLMAPPLHLRSSPHGENMVNFAAAGDSSLMVPANVASEMTYKEGDKVGKIENGEAVNVDAKEKAKEIMEEALDSQNPVLNMGNVIDLKLLQKPNGDGINMGIDYGSTLQQESPKMHLQPTKVAKDESKKEHTAQSNSFPLPMAVASWPGGLPPMGYVAPLQGLLSMEGSTMSSTPIQPLFSQPRGKRCATHYHIAQNIHYIQQLMKMNPFWPAAAGSPTLFGAKPGNFNVMPPAEFNGNITGRNISSMQDKGQSITIFPGHNEKDKTVIQTDQRKQQPILLQQTAPTNILHGPAFIFPFNQQQAAAARPGSAKSPSTPVSLASNSMTASGSTTAAAPSGTTMSFNYPNMSPSETQYLAILQNNGYPFPMGAAPPNYRGTHPQPVPLFNGSFYPSQMIHPSQLQQHQPPPSQSHQSSGQQQRPQGSSGNFQNFPATKNRPLQQQNNQPPPARENEVGSEDSPSTANSRVSMYGQNYGMSIHPQSFALVTPATSNQTEKKHQQPQQQGFKPGAETLSPQTFAMSFSPANGPSSVKSPPTSGHSIAFSRSELADGSASPCNTAATDGGPARALSVSSGSFNVSNLSSLYQNQKLDQQQLLKLQKLHQQHDQQQQQQIAARNKSLSNNGAYPDHLTSSVKFQNVLANFPQSYKQNPSPNSSKTTPNPQVPSSLSVSTTQSHKSHVQSQARLQQISFGSGQKPSVTSANAQSLNNTPSPSSVAVSSPTHSSVSKVTSGSPRSITASSSNKSGQVSTSSVPTPKPSILGNPSLTATSSSAGTKLQQQTQQFSKQPIQQAQLFFSNHYMQPPQGPAGSTVSSSSGYYLQRKRPEQQQQSQQPPSSLVGTGSGTSDPAKAVAAAAAAAAASATKGQSSGIMHHLLPSGFSYGNTVPTGVQAKPAEQKQPAA